MRFPALPLVPLALLGACAVGPDYKKPAVTGENASWATRPVDTGAIEIEPWRAMGDPLLTELVERAVAANLDLRQAEARLREARAGRDAAAGGRLPELVASGSATKQRLSENGQFPFASLPGFDRKFPLYDAGFDASWEIDLWGSNRRAVQAAERRVSAADAQRREVRLRVIAELARAYGELRGAQAEAHTLRSEAQTQRRLATLVRQRYDAGETARIDDAQAEALVRSAEAALPGAEARIRTAAFAIALLTAQPPEALDRLLVPAPTPSLPRLIAAGLRSDILRRRPDVAAAEAQFAAATADVGVETANLFPRLTLIGGVGQQARSVSDLSSGGSTRFQIGPALHWPIFAGGRIRAQIRAAKARADVAAAAYEQAIFGALADSETALNRYQAALTAAQELAVARERSAVVLSLAQQRYDTGEDDLIMLLQAISRFNAADRAATDAQTRAFQAHATLVKALGGGWDEHASDQLSK